LHRSLSVSVSNSFVLALIRRWISSRRSAIVSVSTKSKTKPCMLRMLTDHANRDQRMSGIQQATDTGSQKRCKRLDMAISCWQKSSAEQATDRSSGSDAAQAFGYGHGLLAESKPCDALQITPSKSAAQRVALRAPPRI
jgi:hypothetical protein